MLTKGQQRPQVLILSSAVYTACVMLSADSTRTRTMTCYIPTGRRHGEGDTLLCSKFRLHIKTGQNHCNLVLFFLVVVDTSLSSSVRPNPAIMSSASSPIAYTSLVARTQSATGGVGAQLHGMRRRTTQSIRADDRI